MAIISVRNLIKERKYPFLFALATLLICASLFLFYSSNTQSLTFSSQDLQNPSPIKTAPTSSRNSTVSHGTTRNVDDNNNNNNNINTNTNTDSDRDDGDNDNDSSNPTSSDHNYNSLVEGVDLNIQWRLCKGVVAVDYIPCLDNFQAIKEMKSRRHMEHRERHSPKPSPRCLVPLPDGYKLPVPWPKSRDTIWYDSVPHPKLVEYKKDQHWVIQKGDFLVFPGGGSTQFKDGVTNYINLIEQDEHEAQIQFALERGIPAMLFVIGTQKLTFPDNAFDLIHCARCRVHWDAEGGKPLMELNRILRPGGFFVWSATPVYRDDERDRSVWNSMVALTKCICWKVVAKTVDASGIGLVIYQKPVSSSCYKERHENVPPLCDQQEKQSVPWYAPLSGCLPRLPVDRIGNLVGWPAQWPDRISSKPPSLRTMSDAEEMFIEDTKHWSSLVSDVYLDGLAINWSRVRNIMDMNAGYGGCDIIDVAVEMDRFLRPGGYILVQDTIEMVNKLN